jgi:hypothetical protein
MTGTSVNSDTVDVECTGIGFISEYEGGRHLDVDDAFDPANTGRTEVAPGTSAADHDLRILGSTGLAVDAVSVSVGPRAVTDLVCSWADISAAQKNDPEVGTIYVLPSQQEVKPPWPRLALKTIARKPTGINGHVSPSAMGCSVDVGRQKMVRVFAGKSSTRRSIADR